MKKFINKVKRGFTLVELAIVIAVIAILIAVLVPTFIALIDSANESADKQMIKNINTNLVTEDIISGIDTPSDALDAVVDMGHSLDKLTPTSEDNYIVYDQTTKTFALLDSKYNTLYSYNDITIDPESPATWWIVSSESEMTSTTRSYIITGDIASTATETTASTSGVSLAKTSVSGNKTAQTSSVKLEKDSSGEGYVLTYTGFGGFNTYNVTSNITKVVYNLTADGVDSAYKGWYDDNDFVINIDVSATKVEIITSVNVVINSYGAEENVVKVTAAEGSDVSVTVKDYSGALYVENSEITLTSAISSTVNTITSTAYENATTSTGTLELGTEKYPWLIASGSDLKKVNNGGYCKVSSDKVTSTSALTVDSGTEAILDLYGNTLTITGESNDSNIVNNGTLTITDSSTAKTGTLVVNTATYGITNKGTLTIKGGTIEGQKVIYLNNASASLYMTGGTITSTVNSGYGIYSNISLNTIITGGSISATGTGTSYAIYVRNCSGTTAISNVTISCSTAATGIDLSAGSSDVTIEGVTVKDNADTGFSITATSSGTVYIKDCNITADNETTSFNSYALSLVGNVIVDGGTYRGDIVLAVLYGNPTVKGGTFIGEIDVDGSLTITGGKFNENPTSYVNTENYNVSGKTDNYYTVTAKSESTD